MKDAKKLSKPVLDCPVVRFHCRTARITTRKQAAFTANTEFAPIIGTSKPPKAGPIIPEMFSCKPPKIVAEGSSALETTSDTIDVQTGAFRAKPTPMRNTKTRITWGLRKCSQPRIAMPAAAPANQRFTTQSNFLRSTMSARAPAGRVNKKKGSEATVDRSEIKNGDGVSIFIIHIAAVSWAATQVPEMTAAIHSFRKTGLPRADQVEKNRRSPPRCVDDQTIGEPGLATAELLPTGMDPSIHSNVFARYERRILEIEHRVDDVRNFTHPSEGMKLRQRRMISLVVHRRVDDAGRHCVEPDVVRRVFQRQRLTHSRHRRLRQHRQKCGRGAAWLIREYGRDVYDVPRILLLICGITCCVMKKKLATLVLITRL